MSHPPWEPDGDAASTFSVQGGEPTSVPKILPSVAVPTAPIWIFRAPLSPPP